MIYNNASKGVLNTLQFVLIETGQTSEQRVTIVQTTCIMQKIETTSQVTSKMKFFI